jgi:P4 family phage/plasmid primase-like protien
VTSVEEVYPLLSKYAAHYAANQTLRWKILPVHGIGVDGRCTCGRAHTDPKDIGKHPAIGAWQTDASSDLHQIESWWDAEPRNNIAVMARASGFLVVDVDPRSGGFESLDKFEAMFPDALTPTVEAMTGVYQHNGRNVRGKHLYYRVSENENLIGKLESLSKDLKGVDIKHNGYTLLAPSNHLSGVAYEWAPNKAPWEIEMAEASEDLLGALRKSAPRSKRPSKGGSTDEWSFVNDMEWNGTKLDLDRFLNEGIEEGSRAVDVYAMSCALANKFGTDDLSRKNIETMMIRFNAEMIRPPMELYGQNSLTMHVHRAIDFVSSSPKIEMTVTGKHASAWVKEQVAKQNTVKPPEPVAPYGSGEPFSISDLDGFDDDSTVVINTSDPDDVKWAEADMMGTLGGQVRQIAYSGGSVDRRVLDVPKDPDALSEEEGGDPSRRSLSDLGNGRRFVDTFMNVVRYTPGLGWFNWTGKYWRPDVEDLGTREHAKRLSSIISREVAFYEDNDDQGRVIKWADATKANSRQNNALESATSDPRITVEVESWDRNPTLFGCLNGVINLKTGDLLQGRPDLFITRRAPVAYTPGLVNSRWLQFLDYATGGDKEYQEWLQKAVGYTLTGLRTHDVMFMVYGPGGTGKNVFVEAVVKLMGTKEYAWPMDSQILAQGDGMASGADLYHWAELRGRRMVWVDELPESERLKENSVKKLTGSSEISARSPGEKPFTFNSQAKLWVTTNHRPIIMDDAMWRRIRPIPWMHIPETPDPGLKEYIFDPEGGLPGVLAWAVEGARKVLNSTEPDSLGTCKVVSDAAATYRKNEDRMGKFLEEETAEVPGKNLPINILFKSYENWSEDRGERAMTRIAFDRKLQDRQLKIEGEGRKAVLIDRDLAPIDMGGDGFASGSTDMGWMARLYG